MPRTPTPTRSGVPLLALCLPAVLAGLGVRLWVTHTPLMQMNSDEAFAGLQGYEVLHGVFRLTPAGNDYGATTESYLLAPVLTVWTGVGPVRALALVLSVGAGIALYWLARPIFGARLAAVLALIGWTLSGAVVQLWSRLSLGYTTGFIAQVCALGLACHALRTRDRLARTAFLAGLATGIAIWSHPMFGAVALLAVAVPTVVWRRDLAWWMSGGLGVLIGAAPWLVHIAIHGPPAAAASAEATTYLGRLIGFFGGLLPRALGLRDVHGGWLGATTPAVVVSAVLVVASIAGLVLLTRRQGLPMAPLLVSEVLAFPVLALLKPLSYTADARYSLPFLPALLVGLGAWLLLLPEVVRESDWLVVGLPLAWVALFAVPIIHQQVGWTWVDPDADANRAVDELEALHVDYLDGDYWGTYLAKYLSDGTLVVSSDGTIRLDRDADEVAAADPGEVAWIFRDGRAPLQPLPADDVRLVFGRYTLYVPAAACPTGSCPTLTVTP